MGIDSADSNPFFFFPIDNVVISINTLKDLFKILIRTC
jgi:hypothetical protein